MVLFIMLYMMVLTFEFVDEILKHDNSNETAGLSSNLTLHV